MECVKVLLELSPKIKVVFATAHSEYNYTCMWWKEWHNSVVSIIFHLVTIKSVLISLFFFFISLLTSYKIDRTFATNCMAFQETQFWDSFFFLSPWLSYYIKKHMIGNMFRTGKLSKLLNRLALWLESSLKLWAKISNVDRMGRIFFFPSA